MTENTEDARARVINAKNWRPANPNYNMPRLPTLDAIDLYGVPVPDRRWIVPGWIPQAQVTMLSGDGGVGKSLLAMQLLTACVTGGEWLGRAVTKCRAIGVFCEDDKDEIHRRQDDLNRHFDIGFDDLENLIFVPRVGQDNALMTFGGWEEPGEATELYQQIHNAAQNHGAQVIVLDSLHDLFPGNENSRPHARQFIGLLRSLAMDSDGAVILCAHPSLSGLNSGTGASGSTAWNNAVRSRLYFERTKDEDGQEDNDERVLSRKKANYSSIGDRIRIMWDDGIFTATDEPAGVFSSIHKRKAETAFIECLRKTFKQERNLSESSRGANYAPKTMVRMRESVGVNAQDLRGAMERLFDAGKIKIGDVGIGSDRKPKRGIVEVPDSA